MILASRPLRFLAAVMLGWVGVRAMVLWPVAGDVVPALIGAVAPAAVAKAAPAFASARIAPAARQSVAADLPRHGLPASVIRAAKRGAPEVTEPSPAFTIALGTTPARFVLPPDPLPLGVDPPPTFRASRWSGSAWAILRPDGRATPFASQLGGSQAGARLAYAVDDARRLAIYARASTAIDVREREAAVGVDWRPTRFPVHLVAERRIGIEGVRSGTAIGAVGGVGPTRVAGPVRVEAYGQGGVIVRDGHEGYADGAVRVTLPLAKRIDLGLGAWGGAQKRASRLDLGPTLGVTLPVERHALRLSVDWRQRVAGDSRPGSGPALSLGTDF